MRKLAITAAALAVASPINAQGAANAAGPEVNLRCAAWTAYMIGINKDKPDVVAHLSADLTWFLGRYEGATGKKFESEFTPEFITRVAPELQSVEPACKQAIGDLGGRLTAWGKGLKTDATTAQTMSGQK